MFFGPICRTPNKGCGWKWIQINYQTLKSTWKWNDAGLLHILNSLVFHVYVYLFFNDTFILMNSTFAHFFMLLFSISFPSCIHFYNLQLFHSFVPNFFAYISFLSYSSCFQVFLFIFCLFHVCSFFLCDVYVL